jgi:hypothetical protein
MRRSHEIEEGRIAKSATYPRGEKKHAANANGAAEKSAASSAAFLSHKKIEEPPHATVQTGRTGVIAHLPAPLPERGANTARVKCARARAHSRRFIRP